MQYTITSGQIAFFKKFGYLAVEGLLSPLEIETIDQHIALTVSKKLEISPDRWRNKKASYPFSANKDLWRNDEYLAATTHRKKMILIASLLLQKPLRLLCDEALFSENTKDALLSDTESLQNRSCFRDITLGILIKLTDSPPAIEQTPPKPRYGKGCIFFLEGDKPFPLKELLAEENQAYYLISYGNTKAMFVENPLDPHSSHLKKLGYSFGDPLKEEMHPMVHWV